MTVKKFKRVIPGQLENLKEMFEGYEFIFSCSNLMTRHENVGVVNFFVSDSYENVDHVCVGAFLKLKNGLSLCIEFNIVDNSHNYVLSGIFFSTKTTPLEDNCHSHGYNGKGKKKLREKLDCVIPSYERVHDFIYYLDHRCIKYIEDLFFHHVSLHDSIVNAAMQAKSNFNNFNNMNFIDDEMNEAANLIEVDNVLSL